MKLLSLLLFVFLLSCNSVSDKPSAEKLKECLSNELANKAVIEEFDQQDGLVREKDGVKYYECYFNAEVKFITNTDSYNAGERYKIIHGTLSFMKTERGWNCQEFNWGSSNFVKIKEAGETSNHIDGKDNPHSETPPSLEAERGNGRFPEASIRLLIAADIDNLNKADLKIMRNEIYARHGYIFKTADMMDYFSGQSWYEPRFENVDNLLTAIEKSNITFIKKFE